MKKLGVLVLLTVVFSGFLKADYLKTNKEASVKSLPSGNSPIISKIAEDSYLLLLDEGNQQNGYYHVQLLNTKQNGWIYRTYTRRYPGDIPDEVQGMDDNSPLSDKSYFVTDVMKGYAKRHLAIGKPQAIYERIYEGYVTGEDARLKIPVWVQYELTRAELDGASQRKENFQPDYSIPFGFRSELSDYSGSNYDRGHMAPAADMKRSDKVMDECFYLSNMCPQVGKGFNRDIWGKLEDAIRGWVKQRGTLFIITGPVFMPENKNVSYPIIGENNVAVPTYFYKIVVDMNDRNNITSLAFLLPNQELKDKKIEDFLTSISEIEKLTGLNFLSELPYDVQSKVENTKNEKIW